MAPIELIEFRGGILKRGFWLYVWEITAPSGEHVHYVGRTGDNSSINAQSPFARMGQHLGYADTSCMLRKHLKKRTIEPNQCHLRLIAQGPMHEEVAEQYEHYRRRDHVAAMERELADAMVKVGYDVLNTVRSKATLDRAAFAIVLEAFAEHLPKLRQQSVP